MIVECLRASAAGASVVGPGIGSASCQYCGSWEAAK